MLWQLLVAFLVSMVPLIELRGAIPIAVAMNGGAPEWSLLIVAMLGNMVPVPFIYLFARRVLNWGSHRSWRWFQKFCNFCLKKGEKAGAKLLAKTHGGVYWALFLFVAIPMPGTGAWTGTLAASILKLDQKKAQLAVLAGVTTAGLIMLAASLGVFRLVTGG